MNYRTLGVALIPTVALVLHDLVFQLPDNQHEASLGFFATVAGLLIVWGVTGFLASRRGSWHPLRGAGAAMVSVLALWITFIVLNQVFTERMSYEPDRIRAFQASGAQTMHAFVSRFDPGPFPLLMAVAAVAGSVGGVIAGRRKPQAV